MLTALKPHVLVAEDDPYAALALQEFLTWNGCRVTVTRDGLQALSAYAEDPADIVVTDLMMPRMDGSSLIQELWGRNPDLPVVVVTGDLTRLKPEYRQPDRTRRITLLTKPIKPAQLIESIRELLAQGHEERV